MVARGLHVGVNCAPTSAPGILHRSLSSRPAPQAACRAGGEHAQSSDAVDRRAALASLGVGAAAIGLWPARDAMAIQGLTAGRIPGVTGPGPDGYYMYTRPEGKSGGHGVGWSEIPRYSFKIPEGWDETPVSIADLGGTEIDLRYGKEDCGSLFVVVAPVLRFKDVGVNADVRINDLNTPDNIIAGFAPEVFGKPLLEGDVLSTEVLNKDGVPYYEWEVKPHHLVAATAVGNRLFMLVITANSRQWRKAEKDLRVIQKSFNVPKL